MICVITGFIDDDMLHVSDMAVDYIWEAFSDCYFDKSTAGLWKEVTKISKAVSHRIQTGNKEQVRKFAENILFRIDLITQKNPFVNLEKDREYFLGLLGSHETSIQ